MPPSPELAAKLREQMRLLRAEKGMPRLRASFEPSERPGFNDGLIIPGQHFPAGTPLRRMRAQALERAPLRGTIRVVVVLVDFSDAAMTQTKQHFEELFFSSGTLGTGSVRDFYKEASGGLIDVVGEVVGTYRMPRKLSEYAHGESGTGSALPNARTMARDAVEAANPNVDFSRYDNDGNGYVDAFIVVHAGRGAEQTGSADDIWSHKWVLSGGEYSADGTKVYGYLTVPEDCRVGVCAHELGHLLFGWPDLYDTDNSSEGIGNWCLMAGGSWNNNGDTPAHPSAWCKVNQGWVSVTNQTTNQTVTIQDVKTGRMVYRLWKNGGAASEYFLIENRQRTLFDAHLPGEGLLIFHIDDSIDGNANEAHPQIALEQADGLNQLGTGANRGDGGDIFPGTAANRTFNGTSNPSSKSYGNADTCVSVTNISAPGVAMTARLNVRCVVKDPRAEKHGKERPKIEKLEKERIKPEKEHSKLEKPEKLEKELREKPLQKDFDKPVTDKSFAYDKGFDKPVGEGGWPEWAGAAAQGQAAAGPQASPFELEARIAALEAAVGLQPFIGTDLRPDLSQGALLSEEDQAELQTRMAQGAADAKRSFDTKLRER